MKPRPVLAWLLLVLVSSLWPLGCGDGDELPDSFSRRPTEQGAMAMTVGTQDQTVFGDQRLYLFATRTGGTGSAKIEWRQTAGPPVNLERANTQNPSFTAPRLAETTPLRFEVKATDEVGATAGAAVRVIVEVPQLVVEAGADMDVRGGHRVTLHARARGFYGVPTIRWTQTAGPGVLLAEPNVPNPSFTMPALAEPTVVSFELEATDGTRTGKDTVDVRFDPTPLVVDASETQSVGEKQVVALHAAVNGAAAPTIAWRQTAGPAVVLTDPATTNPTFESPVVQAPTTLSFAVTATDGDRTSKSATSVVVQPSLPVALAGVDVHTLEGSATRLLGEARGGIPPYGLAWTQVSGTAVQLADANTDAPSFTAPSVSADEVLTFRLTLTDSVGHTATDDVNVTVLDTPAGALVARAGPDATVDEGSHVRLRGVGAGGTAPLAYAWRVKDAAGVANITLTVPADAANDVIVAIPGVDSEKVIVLELEVTDSAAGGAVTALDEVALTLSPLALAVDAGVDQAIKTDETVRLTAHATNHRDGVAYAWTPVSGPSATLTGANTANPSFVPTAAGDYVFRVRATDQVNAVTDDVTIHVATAPPSVTAGGEMNASVGDSVSLHAVVGGGATPYQYAWTLEEGPPVTLTAATTSNPSFTVPALTRDTTFRFGLVVTDGSGWKARSTLLVNVSVPQLTVKTGEKGAVPDGQKVSLNAGAAGGVPPFTFSWQQTQGTPQIPLERPDTANPELTSPALPVETTFEFVVTVTDQTGAVANATTHLTVQPVPPVAQGPNKSPTATFQCGDVEANRACTDAEINEGVSMICPADRPFAMTDVVHDRGQRRIFKRCVTGSTCNTEWIQKTSERQECVSYDPSTADLSRDLVCHYCCVTDDCNAGVRPADATLYKPR